jgi:hypothetical protein
MAKFVVFITIIMIVFWSLPCNFAFGEVQEGSELPDTPESEQSESTDTTTEVTAETTEEATDETTEETTTESVAETIEGTETESAAETTEETTDEITEETATESAEETTTEETEETLDDTTDTETTIPPDTNSPVITLIGGSPLMVEPGSEYVDAGATAADDVDGDLTGSIKVVSIVDTTAPGSYKVTYNVSDAAGNAAAEVIRIVNVAGKPTVATDKDDYSPGEIVIVTGSGWLPGEIVKLDFAILSLQLTLTYYATADGEGNIYNNEYIIFEHHLGQTIVLTATGQTTGLSALNIFTDSPKIGSVTIGDRSPDTVYPTANDTFTITIRRGTGTGAFTANLSMLTALPSGCTASFSPAAVSFTAGNTSRTSTLTISTTSGSTPIGITSFTVKAEVSGTPADFATGSGILRVGGISSVTSLGQSPNPVYASNSATYAVTVNRGGGTGPFSANLSITTSLPSGCTYSFSPSTVSFSSGDASKTSVLTVNTSSSTPAGSTSFTIRATNSDNPNDYKNRSRTLAVAKDTTLPTVSLTAYSPDPTGDNTPTYSGSAADTRTNIVDIEYCVDSGTWTDVNAFTPAKNVNFTFTTSTLSDGTHTIYARACDAAGNVSATVSDTLTVTTGTPPVITGQPSSATKTVDESVTFTVTASGTAPLNYQWRKNSINILDATSLSYTISSVTLSDAGSYDVVVTNAYGSATSNAAVLTVNKATPIITWDNPADIVYGTALGGTQLNATASVPGSFVYTPAAGTILNEGAGQNLRVDFTPTDTVNYNSATKTVQINVTPKSVTVTANSGQSKVYGSLDPVLTYTSSDPSVTFTGELSRDAGEDVGSYAITLGTLDAGANYTISFISASFTVTAKDITVTADAKSKVYGDTDPVLTYSSSDPSAAFTGTLSRDAGEDVGTYTITLGTLDAGANYTITFISASFTITAKGITVTADEMSKVYGDLDPVLTYTSSDPSVTFTGLLSRDAGEDAGTYTITLGTLDAGANYTITFISASFIVTAKGITVTADAMSKVYGDFDPVLTYTSSDPSVTFTGELSRDAGDDVGTYTITQGTLDAGANYTINYVGADLAITPAPLTITADDALKVYGDPNPAFSVTYSGFVAGDDESDLNGSLAITTTADNTSPVGTYPITPSGLSSDNYNITFVDGTLTITPAPLTVTADDALKVYDSPNPAFSVTYSGFVAGDDEGDLTGTLEVTTTATETSPVGTYPITPSGLSSDNYSITFVDGTLTITPAPLTVTASDASKVYGSSNPAFSVTYSGFKAGDDQSDLNGSLDITTTADSASPVGTYPITPSGFSSGNYNIIFVDGILTVITITTTLTVTPVSGTYGGTVDLSAALSPAASGKTISFTLAGTSVGSATTDGSGVATLSDVSLLGIDAGSYPNGVGASFSGDANYSASSGSDSLTVTPAPLTATTGDDPDEKLEESIVAVSGETSDIDVETLTITADDNSAEEPGDSTVIINYGTLNKTAALTPDEEEEPNITVAGITNVADIDVPALIRLSPVILIIGFYTLGSALIMLFVFVSRLKFRNLTLFWFKMIR